MKTLGLFCGTKSFSKVAKEYGFDVFTIDNQCRFEPDLCKDIMDIFSTDFNDIYILWASPPCTAFSVASIGKNWKKEGMIYTPTSNNAIVGLTLLEKTIKLISEIKPRFWYIENPRGMMRVMIETLFHKYSISNFIRHTVTYCQYGDKRMKPTDIWTNNSEWKPKKPCKNGDKCHEPAPRGSRTGTQGLKDATIRSIIPKDLFIEIFNNKR